MDGVRWIGVGMSHSVSVLVGLGIQASWASWGTWVSGMAALRTLGLGRLGDRAGNGGPGSIGVLGPGRGRRDDTGVLLGPGWGRRDDGGSRGSRDRDGWVNGPQGALEVLLAAGSRLGTPGCGSTRPAGDSGPATSASSGQAHHERAGVVRDGPLTGFGRGRRNPGSSPGQVLPFPQERGRRTG